MLAQMGGPNPYPQVVVVGGAVCVVVVHTLVQATGVTIVQAAAALSLAALNGYLAGGALGWWRVFGVDIGVRP